jgi:hypothetical protein
MQDRLLERAGTISHRPARTTFSFSLGALLRSLICIKADGSQVIDTVSKDVTGPHLFVLNASRAGRR